MKQGIVFFVAVAACNAPPPVVAPRNQAASRAVVIVLDGLGLAPPAPDNAIALAFERRPDGFLAKALREDAYPWLPLSASGPCVGLPEGQHGNSEAGHLNLCAGSVVLQHRTRIDAMIADGTFKDQPQLVAAMRRAKESSRPLHLFGYLSDRSSVGNHEHIAALLWMAAGHGLTDVQVHAMCDGRGPGGCEPLAEGILRVMVELGVGRFATLVGAKECISRHGVTEELRTCVATMLAPRNGSEIGLGKVWERYPSDDDGHSSMPPTAVSGSTAIGSDDSIIFLPYRRDVMRGVIRLLRGRVDSEAPSEAGPFVTTLSLLDSVDRYADDPRLQAAFPKFEGAGTLHRIAAENGLRELRIAESAKAGHITYFCDGQDVADSTHYLRFHPQSARRENRQPCLESKTAVGRAIEAIDGDEADLILMNLPNADILGHSGDIEATVASIHCVDALLERLVERASTRGFAVFVTSDHGNAEKMREGALVYTEHTQNPVPFIAIAPKGQPEFVLRRDESPPCLGEVAWTVLHALGLGSEERGVIVR